MKGTLRDAWLLITLLYFLQQDTLVTRKKTVCSHYNHILYKSNCDTYSRLDLAYLQPPRLHFPYQPGPHWIAAIIIMVKALGLDVSKVVCLSNYLKCSIYSCDHQF